MAGRQAVQSSGEAWRHGAIAVPRCTMVSDHDDPSTGGVAHRRYDPDEKAIYLKRSGLPTDEG
ncbi:MAG: hypothetical protein L0287_32305 [Anaerolineae bacterium]|nr:hypothetical protein [Anaerolineae bacterium]